MDRRKFISLLSSGIATGAALPSDGMIPILQGSVETVVQARVPSKQKTPNIIILICDDLGYGDLGCYGSDLPTPHIDKMASEGMRFLRYNSAHPICSASRAALLTGRYGHRSKTYGAFGPESPEGTSLDEALLSNLFHDAGYETKAIGKWHLGNHVPYLPTNRGFDSFYGVPYSDDLAPLPLIRDTTVLQQDTDRELLTLRYTEEALKYIEGRGKRPFFLYMAYSYPHDPARASGRFRGKTGLGDYGDAVAEIDWSVGEVIRAVEEKGLTRDTLILFTSDHGPWYQGNPGMLRGRKASTFEGGFRVPLVAKWPGTVAGGTTVHGWYSSLDMLPSMAALCGLKLPKKPLDGTEISGLFRGNMQAPKDDRPRLYFSAIGGGALDVHCIRKQHWKLRVAQGIEGEIYLNDRSTGAKDSAWLQHPELYNLQRDPAESYDVAKYHPEIVSNLTKELDAQMSTFPPNVQQAYRQLKQRKGGISTPPGASPRPFGQAVPPSMWEPPDRR